MEQKDTYKRISEMIGFDKYNTHIIDKWCKGFNVELTDEMILQALYPICGPLHNLTDEILFKIYRKVEENVADMLYDNFDKDTAGSLCMCLSYWLNSDDSYITFMGKQVKNLQDVGKLIEDYKQSKMNKAS